MLRHVLFFFFFNPLHLWATGYNKIVFSIALNPSKLWSLKGVATASALILGTADCATVKSPQIKCKFFFFFLPHPCTFDAGYKKNKNHTPNWQSRPPDKGC